ncbi:hypothetical protein [Clostridium ganghwense]|uniref:DUF1565 domain-containing protein n=1 Tax=Clostridium ganghwense TaxID=312089 RepID=A0ABT4CRA0_9CLOT|nr:hypothetical protein [Clostridium ganghwense]MCY6370963.1 hypothetical protein [Clostridium ganghwense]
MIRNKIFKIIVLMGAALAVLNCSTKVFAKQISNSLTTTIVVEREVDVGDGDKYTYSEINEAIKAADEGQVIKLKGGEYNLPKGIVDKKVTLDSADGEFVDIVIDGELPELIKVKEKVTINKKGVDPINLTGEIVEGSNDSKDMKGKITLNVKSGETVFINVSEKVINKLGFHNAHLMLNLNNNTGVIVSKNKNKQDYTEIQANKNEEYDLGEITEKVTAKIYLTFTEAGTYEVQIYADDNR